MRCIKVSNQDNLYFTDDYVLTHNTTTTSVLTKHLVSSIVKDTDTLLIKEPIGDNIKLKKEINSGVKKVIDFIDKNKIEITGNRIKDIGTVSSNNKEIGNTLAELFSKLGKDAPILVSDNQTLETTHEIIEGMTIDKGFIAKAMVTNTEKSEAVLENANVLVTDYKIQNPQDLATLAQIFSPKFLGINDLLIIADDIQGVPLEFLIQNKMANMIRVIGVKAPALGDYKEILKDVAVLTGATLISKDAGMEFKDITADKLGKAARVVSTMEKTSIVGGAGTKEAIDMRVKEIENQLENTPMKFDQERLRERISKLGSGIGIIRVGGATETEVEEKKAKIDDAINAVRAALKDGGVPGGGVMLLRATSVLDVNIKGEEILHKAIRAPFEQIINNADLEPVKVREKIFASDNLNYGFNVETEEYTDLVESGIIDPALVAKTALTNAVSIALLILDISGANTLVREKEKKENEND
jgi:chaperonin GroEL